MAMDVNLVIDGDLFCDDDETDQGSQEAEAGQVNQNIGYLKKYFIVTEAELDSSIT
jgi:hypothetical protein